MFTPRFTAYTQSADGNQPVAQTNNQNLAWSLAMQATRQAAQANPGLAYAATIYDRVADQMLATIPYK